MASWEENGKKMGNIIRIGTLKDTEYGGWGRKGKREDGALLIGTRGTPQGSLSLGVGVSSKAATPGLRNGVVSLLD